ncbi:GORK [Symbiodinium necroappetens]|uniref:GORK protein n=1 Tax=Symbiodinium necroappetens TaxID=1628268 RepID=A0A813BWL2_9DINO|nr:GORK [Symbiodinium necroappetens]
MAPVDVGSMGYDGSSSYFIRQSVRSNAYREGSVLDFYRGWGVSGSQPSRYFDDLASINRSLIVPCAQTRFMATEANRNYLRITGGVNVLFYWWVPDTTFLDLDPVEIVFPPYDFRAYTSGDKRTVAASMPITKIVSQDLVTLAPSVEDLVRNLRLGRNDVMNMLKDMQDTGDSYATVSCDLVNVKQT